METGYEPHDSRQRTTMPGFLSRFIFGYCLLIEDKLIKILLRCTRSRLGWCIWSRWPFLPTNSRSRDEGFFYWLSFLTILVRSKAAVVRSAL